MISTRRPLENPHNDRLAIPDGGAGACDQLLVGSARLAGGQLIDETIGIWQKRAKRQLTPEDGREIIENMTGFFRILQEWDRAERAAESGGMKSQLSSAT
jgi:hypothetical protein